MAKYIRNNAGQLTETNGLVSSTGVSDANKIVETGSDGRLDPTVMPAGFGAETKSIVAFENLAAGDFVNVFNDSGTIKVRKADASGGNAKRAHGYVLAAVTAPASATVYYGNLNNQLTGLTIGAMYYLSGTAGAVTTTPPTTPTHIVQQIGVATTVSEILVEIQPTITLA